MLLIAFILIAVVIFLVINSGPMPQPNRTICNVLLVIAVVLAILATTGIPGVHIGR